MRNSSTSRTGYFDRLARYVSRRPVATGNVSVFARYDDATPNKDLAPNLSNTYFNVGVAFKPMSGVDLAVVYKQDEVENGICKTSNGTLGGIGSGTHKEFGVWAQVQF